MDFPACNNIKTEKGKIKRSSEGVNFETISAVW